MTSRLPQANELIESLRTIATTIKALGDQVCAERDQLSTDRERYAEASAALGLLSDELADWRELLDGFRLGIVDREELLERTVGRK